MLGRKNMASESAEILKQSVLVAVLEVIYILLVTTFLVATQTFMPFGPNKAILAMISSLIIMVFSAGVSGLLVFGYPIYYVMQKKYAEALFSIGATLGTLFVTLMIIFLAVIVF